MYSSTVCTSYLCRTINPALFLNGRKSENTSIEYVGNEHWPVRENTRTHCVVCTLGCAARETISVIL